ncbi:unnamed protein product [Ranitomeya imitator]|uniref:XK-related protein n=1 Tax=Ranitomeya imitator TaxID=111125 RepID=A0ABN9KWY7_9NEOB|nr:unnamed protein product [Ranitomeya imitator]
MGCMVESPEESHYCANATEYLAYNKQDSPETSLKTSGTRKINLLLVKYMYKCAAVAHYFVTAQFLWAGWTLGLLFPGCVIQAISLVWFRADGHHHCFFLSLAHILQLGILKR